MSKTADVASFTLQLTEETNDLEQLRSSFLAAGLDVDAVSSDSKHKASGLITEIAFTLPVTAALLGAVRGLLKEWFDRPRSVRLKVETERSEDGRRDVHEIINVDLSSMRPSRSGEVLEAIAAIVNNRDDAK